MFQPFRLNMKMRLHASPGSRSCETYGAVDSIGSHGSYYFPLAYMVYFLPFCSYLGLYSWLQKRPALPSVRLLLLLRRATKYMTLETGAFRCKTFSEHGVNEWNGNTHLNRLLLYVRDWHGDGESSITVGNGGNTYGNSLGGWVWGAR